MGDDVTDSALIDLRDADIANLLTKPVDSGMQTALDRILMSTAGGLNGFSNSISTDRQEVLGPVESLGSVTHAS